MVEAGLEPAEALRAATWENSRFLGGGAADFGEIAVGKHADLVLVAGTHRIDDLTHFTPVVDGVVLARAAGPSQLGAHASRVGLLVPPKS
jgi:imidazolonepropionase-like amidohydrolase